MRTDHDDAFQSMIDKSLGGVLSAGEERSLREHLSTCASCRDYLSVSNRVIAGLKGFSFEVNPTHNASVLAALRLKTAGGRGIFARDNGTMRQNSVPLKNWAAFAAALSMSVAGSSLVLQMAERFAVPMHVLSANVQTGVLIFWLLPSLCAAFCLLAAPGEKKGMA